MNFSKVFQKHGLKIVVAIVVILFVYYAYMNIYETYIYMNKRLCVDIKNTSSGYIFINLDVVSKDEAGKYSKSNVISKVSIAKNETKTLSFTASNYGFLVNSYSTDGGDVTYEINNLREQQKYKGKRNFWTRKRKTKYRCVPSNVDTSLSYDTLTVSAVGTALGLTLVTSQNSNSSKTNYTMLYLTNN